MDVPWIGPIVATHREVRRTQVRLLADAGWTQAAIGKAVGSRSRPSARSYKKWRIRHLLYPPTSSPRRSTDSTATPATQRPRWHAGLSRPRPSSVGNRSGIDQPYVAGGRGVGLGVTPRGCRRLAGVGWLAERRLGPSQATQIPTKAVGVLAAVDA